MCTIQSNVLLDEKCGSGSEGMMLIAPPIFSPLGWSGPCSALDDLFDAEAVAEADLPTGCGGWFAEAGAAYWLEHGLPLLMPHLMELPIEHLVLAHGPVVSVEARAALERALDVPMT